MINIFLTLAFYLPGAIHACFVVHQDLADKRAQRIVDAVGKSRA